MRRARLSGRLGTVLSRLRQETRPDDDLLGRFLADGDERAFEAIVLRHTPAVRAACRGWLRSSADIDDAAQATFLVLVRRAATIRDRAALGCWLYRVAENVARRLHRQQARSVPAPADLPAREVAEGDDVGDVVAGEVARLPEKYRLPVQLCYWAGLTTAEAAARLGWPRGTVLTRLAWARKRLHRTLAGRGLGPGALGCVAGAVGLVRPEWARATVRAAKGLRSGHWPAGGRVSERTVDLAKGVVRTMMLERFKYVVAAALVAVALAGFGIHHWVSASDGPREEPRPSADGPGPEKRVAAKDEGPEEAPPRRREAVIRLPLGSYAKEVDAGPYGRGRLLWTYEEDGTVHGLIQGSVMGGEIELATEAEYSLSRHGTIYGVLSHVEVRRLQLPSMGEFAEIQPLVGLWPAFEPLLHEVLVDLPFSYRFRVQGDRLIISNFRILLAGPNPLGKLGGLAAGDAEGLTILLMGFQGLGTALEGTYVAVDSRDAAAPPRPGRPGEFSGRAAPLAESAWPSRMPAIFRAPSAPPPCDPLQAPPRSDPVPPPPPLPMAPARDAKR